MSDKIKGQIRHMLGFAVAYAVGKGWISEQFGSELVGLALMAVPMVWSWFSKKKPEVEQ